MHSMFQIPRKEVSRALQCCLRSQPAADATSQCPLFFLKFISFSSSVRDSHQGTQSSVHDSLTTSSDASKDPEDVPNELSSSTSTDGDAFRVQTLLKKNGFDDIHGLLDECNLHLTDDLVLNVLKRHGSDWKPALAFYNWTFHCRNRSGYSPGTRICNEILDILGRMRRFDELNQVLDDMSKRGNLINERTFGIVVHRLAAAHKIQEATDFFYKRKEFGLELDLIAFQKLLMSLCRFKHAEAAEFLFYSKKNEFKDDIKTRNIILNGWCIIGNLRETKRFWNDIVTSKCKPNKFTYGTFINSLCKAGKISTAVKLFEAMWKKGCKPDVVICNCIIDGLCFKKKIPMALQIFREMNERDCSPDVSTYNTLIKYMCKIGRLNVVYELLDEMKKGGEECLPNAVTYSYLLKHSKNAQQLYDILEKMKKSGCRMTEDTYNLVLKLFTNWDNQEGVKRTWTEMKRIGFGPDQRSYTIMIHFLYKKRSLEVALDYFKEMTLKGMIPEPRTKLLVDAMKIELEKHEQDSQPPNK